MSSVKPDVLDAMNYVSRGGVKLARALDCFSVSPQGRVCIDCGASTGGFTDCLLQRGASLVYAIDVGYGQLAWTLRNDLRVKVMERTNIRYVTPSMLEETPSLAVIDVSFISLSLVLPVIRNLMINKEPSEVICPKANNHKSRDNVSKEVICLVKPQFEAGKDKVGKKGVVRDPETHKEVLHAFVRHGAASDFKVKGITHTPIKGPKGNIEFLGYLTSGGDDMVIDVEAIVTEAHEVLGKC